MDIKKDSMGKVLFYITFSIVLFLALSNLNLVFGALSYILSVLSPVLWGLGIAFVFNIMMKMYENKLLLKLPFTKKQSAFKRRRAISILLTYLSVAIISYIIMIFIAPKISASLATLSSKIPDYVEQIVNWYSSLNLRNGTLNSMFGQMPSSDDIFTSGKNYMFSSLPKIFNFTISVTGGIVNVILGLVFAAYIMFAKESLVRGTKKMLFAFLPKTAAAKISDIIGESATVFERFIGGQILEAVILGTLCFLGMIIFRFPYAAVISVLVGVTALIPILGAYIGTIPSALLILLESPVKAFWFIVFIIVLQQIDNNFIYPKVVGGAIGLSGLWVLFGITVGGSLFGVLGMLLGVPFMAVALSLGRRFVNSRLRNKGEEKLK